MIETRPLPPDARPMEVAAVVEVFRRKRKQVVTFLGYGELGYRNEAHVRALIDCELRCHDPARTVVNTGTLVTKGFCQGIAAVYQIAAATGFETTGIHPSLALHSPSEHRLSRWVQEVSFVHDNSWGGLLSDGSKLLSPTLQAMVLVSDEVVAIGGGHHTAQELEGFVRSGTPVRFHEAEMHESVSRAWTESSGLRNLELQGEAQSVWRYLRSTQRKVG